MYVHAGPVHPEQWPYVFSDNDAERVMRYAEVKLVFIGHTHIPRDHQVSNGRLINVGSVGQPRDGDPRAAYTLFDTETGDRKLVRVDYDYEAAGQAIRKAGLPEFLAARIRLGR
jgi:diadenosine tetraphosphatase ApaH/serine/threonine PP2A family protein phosphatase